MVRPAWDHAAKGADAPQKRMELARIAARSELPPARRLQNCLPASADPGPEDEFALALEYAALIAQLEHDPDHRAQLLRDVLLQKMPPANSHVGTSLSATLELGGHEFPIRSSLHREVLALPDVAALLVGVVRPKMAPELQPSPPAAPPVLSPAAVTSARHKSKRRADPLAAVLAEAKRQALDPKDWQSVWAALVKLAEPASRPPPLVGYAEGEGVQYRVDDPARPVNYLNREALRSRFKRE